MTILNLFPSQIYRAMDVDLMKLNGAFETEINRLRERDLLTVTSSELLNLYQWEEYTSFFTHRRLFEKAWFKPMVEKFYCHVKKYIEMTGIELNGFEPALTECFASIMDQPYHNHARHIHTGAAFSGVYYVRADAGSGTITFEDPALDHWMYQFKYKQDAIENVSEIKIQPKPGELIIFPGHLPHKVNQSYQQTTRVAISFNFVLSRCVSDKNHSAGVIK